MESEDKDAVDMEACVNGVMVEGEWWARDGTTVCVEVVESEDDEDDEDGAGEYARDEDAECDIGEGVESGSRG